MTQVELAYRMGIAQESLCRIERGQRNPSLRLVLRVCLALGTTPNDLLSAALQEMSDELRSAS